MTDQGNDRPSRRVTFVDEPLRDQTLDFAGPSWNHVHTDNPDAPLDQQTFTLYAYWVKELAVVRGQMLPYATCRPLFERFDERDVLDLIRVRETALVGHDRRPDQ
jgi:hypothetical protein